MASEFQSIHVGPKVASAVISSPFFDLVGPRRRRQRKGHLSARRLGDKFSTGLALFFYCFAFGSSCERGKVDNAAQRHGHRFFHSSLADGWRRVEAPITRRSTDDARSSKEMLGLLIDDGGRFSFVFVFVFVFVFT